MRVHDAKIDRDLVMDIGFHNGDDTAFYLSCGHKVVGVEANPLLVERGRSRFSAEISSGRVTIVNAALCQTSGETVAFYVNETLSGWSSLDPVHGQKGGKYHVVEVESVSVADLFEKYGVPWYLKSDVEGADEIVFRGLPEGWSRPKYASAELSHGSTLLEIFVRAGYTGFKLINPETFTQSTPIFEGEMLMRLLRKASSYFSPLRTGISALPRAIRPKKIYWDKPLSRFPYPFAGTVTTGPFGEEADGPWHSAADMQDILSRLFERYTSDGIAENFWYDLHARHRTVSGK